MILKVNRTELQDNRLRSQEMAAKQIKLILFCTDRNLSHVLFLQVHTVLVAVGLGEEFPSYSVWNLGHGKSTYLKVSRERKNKHYFKWDTVPEKPE